MGELGEDFSLLMGETARRWRQRLDERLRPMGLSQAKWRALLHLSLTNGISQRELSEKLSIEGPTLVRLLDRLSRDGYIVRRDAARDRRCKEVHLTRKSHRIIQDIHQVVTELRSELLSGFNQKELRQGAALMRKIRDRLIAA
jgi:MarR family transcriptional regulator for hemolysin